jgi:adenylate cyclase class 2
MPVEIEAKMKVDSLDPVRERLKAAGASPIGEYLETNTFFDTDDRSLLAADQGLRIRRARVQSSGEEFVTITFKGPRQHGKLKSREEIELTVGSFDAASRLLESLAYRRVMSFQKKRQSWKLKDCRVELDELPQLGVYVEIEGPSEDAVLNIRELLQLHDRGLVKASYVALLMAHLQEQGNHVRNVEFVK